MSHKKRNSLDSQIAAHKQQIQNQAANFSHVSNYPGGGGVQPQYSSNTQKQRQVSYSPFSASTKANIPQQQPSNTSQMLMMGAGGSQSKILNQNSNQLAGPNYSSSQQQQMMIMMHQLQKSQIQQQPSSSQSALGHYGNSQQLAPGAPHHNRSESATPGSGGVLDRQLIDFMTAKHHNNSVNYHPSEKKASSTSQPIIGAGSTSSAFNKKKKSHQIPSTSNGNGGYGSIIIGNNSQSASKEGLLLFGSNGNPQSLAMQNFTQKRNSMNDAERRRQQQNLVAQSGLKNKGYGSSQIHQVADSSASEKGRPIRSANSSPTTHHFLMNQLGQQQQQQQNQGLNLLHDILPTPQTSQLIPSRPATGNLIAGQHSNSMSGTAKGGSPNSNQIKLHQRPKTSNKVDNSGNLNQSTSVTTTSTNAAALAKQTASGNNTGGSQFMSNHAAVSQQQPHHTKSMSEDNVKRMLKKGTPGTSSKNGVLNPNTSGGSASAPTSKPQTRPSSGQKKSVRPTQSSSSQGHYDQQSQQQLMMMLLLQQQNKVKSISDSHRVHGNQQQQQPQQQPNGINLHQQKINNFVDVNISTAQNHHPPGNNPTQNSVQLSNQELQHIKGQLGAAAPKVNQSTDFASMNNKIQLNSKFQSAPSTPNKHLQVKKGALDEEHTKPQLIERNVITKYAFATRVGFIPNNPNKVNQDSFILSPNLNGCNFRHYFGVCDGHGQNGKEASHFIKLRLPQLIGKGIDETLAAINGQQEGSSPAQIRQSPAYEEYKQIFHKSFVQCNEELDFTNFDVNLSGSTVCTVLFNGTKVYCGNAGDSRAIKVAFSHTQDQGGSLTRKKPQLEVTALNRDHKPELKDEAERIQKRGGRIDSFRDYYNNGEPIGPQRVWLMNEEIPGLAMSRSMGDKVAHSVGVSAEPETWEFTLGLTDRYLVIASDGVWEFLSNEDVANIVFPFYEQNAPEAAANALVKAAFKKWKQEEEVIDDITVVIIFLEPSMAYNSLKAAPPGGKISSKVSSN